MATDLPHQTNTTRVMGGIKNGRLFVEMGEIGGL
jgi:hypothetical protein